MNLDRSLVLDMGLGISVAAVYYMSNSSAVLPNQLLLYAAMVGLGTTLFARFFIRRFFLASPPPSPEELQEQLEQIDAFIRESSLESEQKIALLEQAGAIALTLERWPMVVRYYTELTSQLQTQTAESPVEQEVLERRIFHTKLAISFALLQDNQKEESLNNLEALRYKPLVQKEPILSLLIDLFHARVISQDEPERGKAMLEEALSQAEQQSHEEDALRLVASEWLELEQAEEAIVLLRRAQTLAQNRGDNIAEAEILYQLGFAYGAAKQLPQAAQTLVLLTQQYIKYKYPTPQHIEQLREQLREQFGKQSFRDAFRKAKKEVQ